MDFLKFGFVYGSGLGNLCAYNSGTLVPGNVRFVRIFGGFL